MKHLLIITLGFFIFEIGDSVTSGVAETLTETLKLTTSNITYKGSTVWYAGNDGSGSGLDADLLDGQQGSYYQNAGNLNAGLIPSDRVAHNTFDIGDTTPETGRTVHETGIYTFNVNNNSLGTGTDTSYYSVLAFGQGAGGSAQIAAKWTNTGDKLYYRSLRDTTDDWWDWKEILHSGSTAQIKTGELTLQQDSSITTNFSLHIRNEQSAPAQIKFSNNATNQNGYFFYRHEDAQSNSAANSFHFNSDQTSTAVIIDQTAGNSGFYVGTNKVWHAGNDGSGSGLDADTLDGVNSTSFLRSDVNDIKTAGYLRFEDGVVLTFGTGADMEIFHNGNDGYVRNNVTGNLYLANTFNDGDVIIQSDNGSGGNATYFLADGSTGQVRLYQYGVEKFQTTAEGILVNANVGLGTTAGSFQTIADFRTQNSNTSKLRIVEERDVNGSDWNSAYTRIQKTTDVTDQAYIQFNGSGNTYGMEFGTVGDEKFAQFIRNGAVELYHNGNKKLETGQFGVVVTGSLAASNIDLVDNAKLLIGTGDDLQIYHDGTNSFIESNTNELKIAGKTRIVNNSNSESIALFTPDGSVELYYNNSKKFETVSNGVKITGGLQDKDGQLGSSGQVLSSTGTELNWVAADSGPQGTQGLKGNTGNTGGTGGTGPQGTQGTIGGVGPQGAVGAQGIKGSDGTNGSNGSNGAQGTQGTVGSNGTNGDIGAPGAQGTAGTAGPSNSITVSATTDSTAFPVLVGSSSAGTRTPLVGDQFTFNESNGNLTCSGTVTANSDVKLKKNITTIDNALDKVLNLRGVEFDYKKNDTHSIGVIAQEVEQVLPDLVQTDKKTNTKSVAYGNLTAVLIEAIKELTSEVDELKSELNKIKGT